MKTMYCTHNINSFRVNEDQIMYTYYFIPQQRVVKKGWLIDKMVPINCGWLLDDLTDTKLLAPKRYDYIDMIINEENNVYDFSKVEDGDFKPTFGVDINDSEFNKWFKRHFENSSEKDKWYYKTITNRYGKIDKIEIYLKGSIKIETSNTTISYFTSIDFHKRLRLVKDIEKCILKYPFFTQDSENIIYFYNLNENNEYNIFYIV